MIVALMFQCHNKYFGLIRGNRKVTGENVQSPILRHRGGISRKLAIERYAIRISISLSVFLLEKSDFLVNFYLWKDQRNISSESCILSVRCTIYFLWLLGVNFLKKVYISRRSYKKIVHVCVQEDKNMKRFKKNEEAVSPVIAIILMVAITVVLAGVLYMWVISLADTDEDVDIMYFTLDDGDNIDEERGCFFLIRAGKGVNIDPSRYSFYVSEVGYSPQKLDFSLRAYKDDYPYGPDDTTGDRNKTYDYKVEGDLWNDGEYLGFDMPMKNNPNRPMQINIKTGVYEVMIKNPKGAQVYSSTFSYTKQGFV